MRMAVFDIDGTLVTGPGTEKRFWLRLLREGMQGPPQLLAWCRFAWREYPRAGTGTLRRNKAYLAGLEVERVAALAATGFTGALARAWYPPCLARLRHHQAQGDRVVLMSGTPDFVARAIAAALGVDHAIGTLCANQDGRFSAAAPVSHPFGQRKAELLEQLCTNWQAASADVIAYGDSIHDLPLLERAGVAVAVRPDRRLDRAARERGWEVLGSRRLASRAGALAAARLQ
jgi:HAD superfamily hydrolase (TIGR01490 family)